MRSWGQLGLALVVVAAGFSWWLSSDSHQQRQPVAIEPAVAPVHTAPAVNRVERPAAVAPTTGPVAAMPSLEGTAIDGRLTIGADGQLRADVGLRRLLDYFLADADRVGQETMRASLAAALAQQGYPPEVTAQVLAYLDRYLEYRQALAELPVSSTASLGGRLEELRAAYEGRYALRRQLLGAELAEAFFGHEEIEDGFVLERQALLQNRALSEAERRQQLALLEQQLPADIRAAREQSQLALTLREQTGQLRQAQASDAEVQQLREQLLGPAAATRLATLDREREQWQQRLQRYGQQRDRILAAPGLSDSDKQAALESLLQREFNQHEARRVRALERMAQLAE